MLLDKHYDMIAAPVVKVTLFCCLDVTEKQNAKKLLASN